MTLTQLYFFTVILPNIDATLGIAFGILLLSAIVCFVRGAALDDEEKGKNLFIYARKILLWAGITAAVSIPLPGETQLYALAGGYVVTNAKDVQKLPDNVVKAANAWLEKAATTAAQKNTTK